LHCPDFEIDYKDWTGALNVPGHLIWPVYIRQEPHREQIGGVTKAETMHRIVLRASCSPVRTLFGTHWAMRHLPTFTGPMGWMGKDGQRVETVWCANGPAKSIYDTSAYSSKTGCLYWTEEAPAFASGASPGWGWIKTSIVNWESQFEKMLLPCGPIVSEPQPQMPPESSLVASVNIATTMAAGVPLGPGLYMLSLNATQDNVDKTYVYTMDQGREVEVPLIFEPGFLYIRDSSGWYKPNLGVMRDVRPEREFEPVEIPVIPRGPVWP
jgi:hypothetical protein